MRENEWIAFAKTANGIGIEIGLNEIIQIESNVYSRTHFPHFVHSKHISWFQL